MKIKVAQYIANFLVDHEVEQVFTVTGGGAMHLNDALGHHPSLTSVYNHHEQACAIAAEAYTRLTNKIAAVCVTSGPGGTNAITGVLGGWLDSIPMFVISGQVKFETTIRSTDVKLRQLGDQEFNIVDCVNAMTKYAVMIIDKNDIRYHLEKAWYFATTGRGGPVWIDVPLDIQSAFIETDELKGFEPSELSVSEAPVYDEKLTQKIIDLLKNSKKPIILVGSGVRLGKAHDEFIELLNKVRIPVLTAWNAHDVLWDDHALYCGRPGTLGNRGGNTVVQNADLLLVLGSRLNIRQISYNYRDFAKEATKIIVDIDANELKKPTVKPDLPIHANVKDVLVSLNKQLADQTIEKPKWLSWCRTLNLKYPTVLDKYRTNNAPVNPYVFMDELFDQLIEGDTVITGNGSACVIGFQAAKIKQHQRLFTNSGCAAMGYGLPAALGGAIARKGERTICLDGDGSFQMNIQELQTIVYHQMNLKIFVLNNNGYHSIRQTQRNFFKPPLLGVNQDNGISFPDLSKLIPAYGIPYVAISELNGIQDKLKQVLSLDGPVVCEVFLDTNQNFEPKVSSKVMPDGKVVSLPMDDMFPFLEREEYESNRFIEED